MQAARLTRPRLGPTPCPLPFTAESKSPRCRGRTWWGSIKLSPPLALEAGR